MSGWLILSGDLFPVHVGIVFGFGALLGSFFNVCIYRLPVGQSVNRPRRSFCPSCGETIAWYDNIPLWSYLRLGGVCRHCGGRISSRYFWVELLTALLFAGVFWIHGYQAATLLFLLLTGILIVSTFTDLDHWIIPDSISLGGTVLGLAGALGVSIVAAIQGRPEIGSSLYVSFPFDRMGPWQVATNALAGAVFGFVLLWTIGVLGTMLFRKEAMGMGDMKLFACIGAFVGWQGCLAVLVLASFLGATLGLSLLLAQWIVAKLRRAPAGGRSGRPAPRRQLHHLPFGPYIAVAGYIVALFYRPMTAWVMERLFFLNFSQWI